MCARASAMAARSPSWWRKRSAGRSARVARRKPSRSRRRQSRPRAPPKPCKSPFRTSTPARQARVVLPQLSEEEKDARMRALADSRQRDAAEREKAKETAALNVVTEDQRAQERKEAEERKRKEDERHQAEAKARKVGEETAAQAPAQGGGRGGPPHRRCPAQEERYRAASRRGAPGARPAHHHQRARRGAAPAEPCLAEAPPGAPEKADHRPASAGEDPARGRDPRGHHHSGARQPHGRARRRRHQVPDEGRRHA